MPPQEQGEVRFKLVRLGDGQVVLDIPSDMLYENEQGQPPKIAGPPSPHTSNLRLMDGLASIRPGLGTAVSVTGASRTTARQTGAANCIFDDSAATAVVFGQAISGGVALTKITGTTIVAGVPTTPGTDVTPDSGAGDTTPTNGNNDWWSFAAVRRTGSTSPQNQWMATNGKNPLYYWTGTGKFKDVGAAAPIGGKIVFGYQGRAYVCNTLDASNRKHSRMERSGVGDPLDWTGPTVGTVDLDDDPYPISAVNIVAGAPTIYKGDNTGGSIVRATPTGSVNEPLRFDTVVSDVGILCPRTLVTIGRSRNFFVGHDGFYIHDGLRGIQPILTSSTRQLVRAINQGALYGSYAYYRPYTKEVVVSINTGDSEIPTQSWVYNTQSDKLYGPWIYANNQPTTSTLFADIGGISWDDLTGTWNEQQGSWNTLGSSAESFGMFHGNGVGQIFYDDDRETQDNGTAVSGEYHTGWIHARGRQFFANSQPVTLDDEDMLSLYEVTVGYHANQAWTPTVTVAMAETGGLGSTGAFVISDGVELAAGKGELRRVKYNGSLPQTSRAFKISVAGSGGIELEGISIRAIWGGDEQAG